MTFTSCATTDLLGKTINKSSLEINISDVIDAADEIEEDKKLFQNFQKEMEENQDITPENEYYIGRSVAATILKKYPLYTKAPEFVNYLNRICAAITVNSDNPYLYKGYKVAILDTDEINAMATPGGHIFISRGLINCTDSEDALAAVIAHEVAHIQLNHCMNSIKSSRTNETIQKNVAAVVEAKTERYGSENQVVSDEDIKSFLSYVYSGADALIEKGFPSAQEYEADKKALELMSGAGYDPNAMIDMLNQIEKKSDAKSGWGTTHPKPKDRIKNVTKVISKSSFTYTDKSKRQERFEKNLKLLK